MRPVRRDRPGQQARPVRLGQLARPDRPGRQGPPAIRVRLARRVQPDRPDQLDLLELQAIRERLERRDHREQPARLAPPVRQARRARLVRRGPRVQLAQPEPPATLEQQERRDLLVLLAPLDRQAVQVDLLFTALFIPHIFLRHSRLLQLHHIKSRLDGHSTQAQQTSQKTWSTVR